MIRSIILSSILNSQMLWVVSQILPNYIEITGSTWFIIIPGVLLGILNSLLKPLIKLLSLPLIVLTAGMFSIVINAFIIFALEFIINIININEIGLNITGGVLSYFITGFAIALLNEFSSWLLRK